MDRNTNGINNINTVYCNNCGCLNNVNSNFCSRCGADIRRLGNIQPFNNNVVNQGGGWQATNYGANGDNFMNGQQNQNNASSSGMQVLAILLGIFSSIIAMAYSPALFIVLTAAIICLFFPNFRAYGLTVLICIGGFILLGVILFGTCLVAAGSLF